MSEQTGAGAPLLVTGGTGTLGKHVVATLREASRPVRVLSRRSQESQPAIEFVTGDLATGEGVEAAVAGTEVILHLAGSAKGDDVKTRTLVDAARRGGNPHLVYISVVGADKVPMAGRIDRAMFGYYGAKLASEQIIEQSGLPWTTLRATQFHDLVFTMVQGMAKLPVIPVPTRFNFQPIEAAEVADRLVELASSPPAGFVEPMGGPRIYPIGELLGSYLDATHRRRVKFPVRVPGKAARALREGANLAPDRAVGRRSWEEFLAAKLGPAPVQSRDFPSQRASTEPRTRDHES
jgi:uncharacterized protein YbjT (DUF2867 family)